MEGLAIQIEDIVQENTQRPLRRRHIIPVAVVCVVLAILAVYPLWLPGFYRILDVSQLPVPADVIVVLGGSGGPRELYAVELYRQRYAPEVVLSGYIDSMDYGLDLVVRGGVLKENILVNDQAVTTYNEAEQILALLLEMNTESALIVTDRFHSRRAAATYNYLFQNHDIELTFVSPDDGIDPSNWWQSPVRDQVVSEYLKMLFYGFHYGVWSW